MTTAVDLYVFNCPDCNISMGIPQEYRDRRSKDGQSFWCPNGHSLSYGDTEEKRLKRERDQLKKEKARLTSELDQTRARADSNEALADHREAQRRGEKAAKTRLRKRIREGLCIHCDQHFDNVKAHMEAEHKEATEELVEGTEE